LQGGERPLKVPLIEIDAGKSSVHKKVDRHERDEYRGKSYSNDGDAHGSPAHWPFLEPAMKRLSRQ
jgi:hypothetical protein